MAEPQPPNVHEGADVDEPSAALPVPATAEDRKAAAALSSLTTHTDDVESQKPHMDQEALGKAMGKLGMQDGGKKGEKEGEGAKKKVKVDAGDVALLVEELELSKGKATELLKAHEGDAVKAMRAYVSASA